MIGARLGPYEITAKLGEGGMGEVYRARDTKLERDVAIKLLPAAFLEDPDRLARFEREAKLLAQLHHPHIASIFGLEESGGVRALVMELVEGPTLADRLESGSLSLDESLSIARQIAEALETAHEKGIVHRDLKPQNVKASIEGKVKVLDFGLAKALDPVGAASSSVADLARSPTLLNSPTLTTAGTQLGVILGTAAYMAPEQARGQGVDKRADIWAFGVVLFEILTGRSLFAADTVSDTLAGVLKTEIDLSKLPESTPPAIRRLLRRCLERNPKNRLHDIADARIVLDDVASGRSEEGAAPGVEPAPAASRRALAVTAAAALAAGALLAALLLRGFGESPAAPVAPGGYAFEFSGPGEIWAGAFALSPDGRRVVYVARGEDGVERLWVRAVDAFEPAPLAGTEGARHPFFSPDGREIAFQARDELLRVPIAGGAARKIAAIGGNMMGGAWGADGVLLLGNRRGRLLRVPAAGGGSPVEAVERTEAEGPNTIHAWPAFLADGRRFVYLADGAGGVAGTSHRFLLGSLDGGPPRELVEGLVSGLVVDKRGYLLFVRNDQLLARPFDADRGELLGEEVLVSDDVSSLWDFHEIAVAVSGEGAVAFQSGSKVQRLDWLDEAGRPIGTVLESEAVRNPRLSPDGRFLAAETQHTSEDRSVWVLDLERGVRTLLSERGRLSDSAAWSPDGRWVYFDTKRDGQWQVVRQPREGSPKAQDVLVESVPDVILQDVSPDGRTMLLSIPEGPTWDYYLVPLDRLPAKPALWFDARGTVDAGRFSPDGRWIAYVTDESGRKEVYVGSIEGGGARRFQVSSGGGTEPVWSRDGRRLYFRRPDHKLLVAEVELGEREVVARAAEPLFALSVFPSDFIRSTFDVAADGRLLVLRPMADDRLAIRVLTDWQPLAGR